jgi:hypothetical protein
MPSDPRAYPPNWQDLKVMIRARAQGVCECRGECGLHHEKRCVERHHKAAIHFRGTVALATAHICRDGPACAKVSHLKALCQRCHLRFDATLHWEHRKATRGEGEIQSPFPPGPPNPH